MTKSTAELIAEFEAKGGKVTKCNTGQSTIVSSIERDRTHERKETIDHLGQSHFTNGYGEPL